MMIVPIVTGAFGTVTNGFLKGLEDVGVGGRVGTTQMTTLLKTEKSAGDLRRLPVTQTPEKSHQLPLM